MNGFRVGSILGFTVRVDFSWFIVFFLILWTFAMGVYPATVPGLSRGVYFVMGVTTTLLFFASLLTHEISHSLVARAKGIPVEGITLFIFGGMAQTRGEAESPRDEFLIAGVGPLTSLVLALGFGGLFMIGAGFGAGARAVLRHLAVLNVTIAVFNLLPGFPLDGGRLFRAALWKMTGDLTRATRIASRAGSGLGLLLVAIGIWQTFGGERVLMRRESR